VAGLISPRRKPLDVEKGILRSQAARAYAHDLKSQARRMEQALKESSENGKTPLEMRMD